MVFICLVFMAYLVIVSAEVQPNPPKWPSTVRVFSPEDTDIEDVVNAAYAENGGHTPANHGQFSSARFAFLFKPGKYSATVPVGCKNPLPALPLRTAAPPGLATAAAVEYM